jgi:hypothetical protein
MTNSPTSHRARYNTPMNTTPLDNQTLLTYLTRHLDQYLDDLRTLTAAFEAGTLHKPGVDAAQELDGRSGWRRWASRCQR